jgi:arsenite methyltransferase
MSAQVNRADLENVGYYFHLLDDLEGARVLDLGSGSGMDTFVASLLTGPAGSVIGLDMTDSQRAKAEALRRCQGVANITYVKGYIDRGLNDCFQQQCRCPSFI